MRTMQPDVRHTCITVQQHTHRRTPEVDDMYQTIKTSLADMLKHVRTQKKLTQYDLAVILETDQSRVSKMESADMSVSIDSIIRALLLLGVTQEKIGACLTTNNALEKIEKQTTITRQQAIDHLTNAAGGRFQRALDIVRTARGVMLIHVVNKPMGAVAKEYLLITCTPEDAEVYMSVVRDNGQHDKPESLK